MSQTISQEITGKLARRIANDRYPMGTKLPTERDLAAEFGVTRHVVREALKRLEAVGLVRIRQGSGIVVEDFKLSGGIEMFEVLLTHDDGSINMNILRDVLEFRGHMVQLIVRLAADRRSPDEMKEMVSLFNERKAAANNPARLEVLNRRLFRLIAKATHNRIYELVFNTMGQIFLKLRLLIDLSLMNYEEAEKRFERILDAFEQQDGDLAELLVARYLESIRQNLDEHWRSQQQLKT
jgi:GntR family transcriptional regulator, transcriptional repressor for pyruvate dehydrogenase complex